MLLGDSPVLVVVPVVVLVVQVLLLQGGHPASQPPSLEEGASKIPITASLVAAVGSVLTSLLIRGDALLPLRVLASHQLFTVIQVRENFGPYSDAGRGLESVGAYLSIRAPF